MRRSNHFQTTTALARISPLLLLLFSAGCSDEVAVEKEVPVRPAKLVEITQPDNERTGSFPAVIEPSGSSEITFLVGGKLQELNVRAGQELALDEVIGKLEQTSFQNDLAAAQSQYDNAQAEYSRARKLVKENAISRSIFEQRRTQRDVARTTLNSAQKAFDDTVLRSPFAGVVATVHTEQFQNVQALESIITLQTSGAAEAVVQVPATLVADSGRITPIETQVILDAAPNIPIPAVFKSNSTQADPNTQTFEVKFGFTPPAELVILPGMTGKVRFRVAYAQSEETADATVIPLNAVLSDGAERYAWLVDTETMTVSRRNITVGSGIGESLIVIDGLEVGDTVVGAGTSYLQEGMKIRAYEPQ